MVVSRFQSICDDSEFLCFAQPRQKINLDYRKTFLEINYLRLIHPVIVLKEFNLMTCKETVKQRLKQEGRILFTPVKTDKIKAQYQCRHFCDKTVDYEFYNTGEISAELHGRASKTANIGSSVENSIQNTSQYLFLFSIGCYVVNQRSGNG